MAGEVRTILAYLADTLLPSIDGGVLNLPEGRTHTCTFDFTGTGRVVFGRPPSRGPELVDGGQPVVYLFPASPVSAEVTAAPPASLSEYALLLRVGLEGFVTPQNVAGEGDTARGKVLRAADLLNDLMAAIEADRDLGGHAFDATAQWQLVDGARVNAPRHGTVQGLLTITTVRV